MVYQYLFPLFGGLRHEQHSGRSCVGRGLLRSLLCPDAPPLPRQTADAIPRGTYVSASATCPQPTFPAWHLTLLSSTSSYLSRSLWNVFTKHAPLSHWAGASSHLGDKLKLQKLISLKKTWCQEMGRTKREPRGCHRKQAEGSAEKTEGCAARWPGWPARDGD